MIRYRNILVIQTAFIGDAILASSVAETLHGAFPEAQISMLVRKGHESLFSDHPFIKEVLTWDKKQGKLRHLLSLLRQVRSRRFDCVINCHRYLSSGLVTAFSGARHTAGFKENPLSFLFNHTARHTIGDGAHEIQRYQRLLKDLAPGEAANPKLYPTNTDLEKISPFVTTDYVCMAPASVWFTKQLPEQKWVELCNLQPATTIIYLLGGPEDDGICKRIKNAALHSGIHVMAGRFSFLQSAALMRSARMNYVNDSAPLHLASSVDAPVRAFFCSTVPAFGFGPLSKNSMALGVEDLPCRPCGIHGYKACPLGHFKCGRLIEVRAGIE